MRKKWRGLSKIISNYEGHQELPTTTTTTTERESYDEEEEESCLAAFSNSNSSTSLFLSVWGVRRLGAEVRSGVLNQQGVADIADSGGTSQRAAGN